MNEHGPKPVRRLPVGLPGPLPKGEALFWQGAPAFSALARRVMRLPLIALYFAALLVWREALVISGGASPGQAIRAGLWIVLLAACALSLLAVLAWLIRRTTLYTITSHRIAIRFGIALSATINIPFRSIEKAGLRIYPDGTGDIPLSLARARRVGYLIMWPHVRPWRFTHVEPMLRGVPEAARVGQILARALAASAAQPAQTAPVPIPAPAPVPAGAEPRAVSPVAA